MNEKKLTIQQQQGNAWKEYHDLEVIRIYDIDTKPRAAMLQKKHGKSLEIKLTFQGLKIITNTLMDNVIIVCDHFKEEN